MKHFSFVCCCVLLKEKLSSLSLFLQLVTSHARSQNEAYFCMSLFSLTSHLVAQQHVLRLLSNELCQQFQKLLSPLVTLTQKYEKIGSRL